VSSRTRIMVLDNASQVTPAAACAPDDRPSLLRTAIVTSIFIFVTFLGLSMLQVPIANMFLQRACAAHGVAVADCAKGHKGYDKSQVEASKLMQLYGLASPLAQICSCTLLGRLGDARGRRVHLLAPVIGVFLCRSCLFFFPAEWENTYLMLGLFLAGFLGSDSVSSSAVFAALADATRDVSAQKRSLVFGAVEGLLWCGLLAGPAIGGALAEIIGNEGTLVAAMCMSGVLLCLVLFVFEETLPRAHRNAWRWTQANPFHGLFLFCETRTTVLLAIITIGGFLGSTGGNSVMQLYGQKVGLGERELGIWGSVSYGSSCLGLFVILPGLFRRMSLPSIMRLSLSTGAACWFFMGCATAPWELYLGAGLQVLSAFCCPIVRTGMANACGRLRYGESLAAVGCMEQIGALLAPIVVIPIYQSTENSVFNFFGLKVYGMVFVATGMLQLIGFTAACLLSSIPELVTDEIHDSVILAVDSDS